MLQKINTNPVYLNISERKEKLIKQKCSFLPKIKLSLLNKNKLLAARVML